MSRADGWLSSGSRAPSLRELPAVLESVKPARRVRLPMILRNLRVALFLVVRAVRRGNRSTLLLTMLIISLAFINMTFMSSLMNGLVAAINEQVMNNYVANIVAEPPADEQYIRKAAEVVTEIENTPGIVACSPRYVLGATIVYHPRESDEAARHVSWPVRSIEPARERMVTHLHEYMLAGEYLEASDRDAIMLGRELSGGYGAVVELQTLDGADIGDEVSVLYSNGVRRTYTVKGIFATKFPLTDMDAFVTQKEMESVLGLRDRASEILVRSDGSATEAELIAALKERGLTEVILRPWTDYLSFFKSLTDSLMRVVSIVSSIGLLVAGITIFIVIYINAFTRRRQIGILKAIGMSERIVTTSYVFQALFYGLVGIGVGACVMNFLLAPHFAASPLQFPIGNVRLVVTGTELLVNAASLIVVSLIGGYVPSRRVAKADIIKAIWG